ncbi:bud neck involved protein [Amphichorda felina]
MDDMHIHQQSQAEAKALRRRSMHTQDPATTLKLQPEPAARGVDTDPKALRAVSGNSAHSRSGSSGSVNSSRSNHSRPSSANRNATAPAGNPSSAPSDDKSPINKQEQPKSVAVPPRGSSTDVTKRTLNPSPLSKPATMATDSAEGPSSSAVSGRNLDSPAAKQLAAINQKGGKAKSKTSRLRRAFSFGSAAELRKAAGEVEPIERNESSKLHKEPNADEAYDAEQARIAEAQEAAGIGSSIYGGRFFGGSTDNLSISSTASSASIMIRKMGRGMKKSTRSLAGLFRPKSVLGAPSTDPIVQEGSQAAVSMVTVEAEAQRVNVSAEPQSSDTFPHLERNSLDANQVPEMGHERTGSSGTDNSHSRKSIVGGDKERAEVLAAVRKGILKRSGSSSPSLRPVDRSPDLPSVPAISDSPNSSAPSTPNDEVQRHSRTSSMTLRNEDYFMSALRLRQNSQSTPGTPQGGSKRNATFSPRIIFYDTWPSQEYDRRGEIATCNRLTPMLAQQIKEELNTFKMEMEVHENSKIYTHFF